MGSTVVADTQKLLEERVGTVMEMVSRDDELWVESRQTEVAYVIDTNTDTENRLRYLVYVIGNKGYPLGDKVIDVIDAIVNDKFTVIHPVRRIYNEKHLASDVATDYAIIHVAVSKTVTQ